MAAPPSNLIRSVQDGTASSGRPAQDQFPPSRLAAGPPQRPLRPVPPKMDPADASTLDMLGESPLDQVNGGGVSMAESGGPGMALGAVAMILQGSQLLSTVLPGTVPPEVLLWIDNLMTTVPQIIQQQSSGMGMMAAAAGGAPMMPGTGAAPMGALGPPQGAAGPSQPPPRPPM